MSTTNFAPEGNLVINPETKAIIDKYTVDINTLQKAKNDKIILEARCIKCDAEYNLIVNINGIEGIIHHNDGAIGIEEKTTKDSALVTRVGKFVQFIVKDFETDDNGNTRPILSRRDAQIMCRENYVNKLVPGDVIPARVTHCEPYGAFVDIGAGVISLLPIANISISRISHAADRFDVNDDIFVVVSDNNLETNKISVSHKELLGTWAENAANFNNNEIVTGIVREIKDYGLFIELAPNFVGLADITGNESIEKDDLVSVHIKNIAPDNMKVKLDILYVIEDIDENMNPMLIARPEYYITDGHIDTWRYSTENSSKIVETVFDK